MNGGGGSNGYVKKKLTYEINKFTIYYLFYFQNTNPEWSCSLSSFFEFLKELKKNSGIFYYSPKIPKLIWNLCGKKIKHFSKTDGFIQNWLVSSRSVLKEFFSVRLKYIFFKFAYVMFHNRYNERYGYLFQLGLGVVSEERSFFCHFSAN